jgi:hypothetical protein
LLKRIVGLKVVVAEAVVVELVVERAVEQAELVVPPVEVDMQVVLVHKAAQEVLIMHNKMKLGLLQLILTM